MPNVARIYDYWLGGRENFQADRAAAEQLIKLVPDTQYVAHDNRAFLHRAVRFLAERGINQFLDNGTGMPGVTTVLDTARQANPDCRVAYVDYDPIVVSRAGAAHQVEAGRHRPGRPPAAAGRAGSLVRPRALDFGKPVAVLVLAVLHFISDNDDPPAIMTAIRDALAPRSYLAIGHVTHDNAPDAMVSRAIAAFAKTSASIWPRTASQIRHLFNGFDLVEPGLVPAHTWRPDPGGPPVRENALILGGVARKG